MKASLILLLLVPTFLRAAPQQAVVVVPVADVWSRPLADGEKPVDDLRETQVLFGEKVLIHESSGPWVRIEAVEQPEFTHHNKWEGYPGWVLNKALNSQKLPQEPNAMISDLSWAAPIHHGWLPMGAKLFTTEKITPLAADHLTSWPPNHKNSRGKILITAEIFLGDFYLWGGLIGTPEDPADGSLVNGYGIDCSGLVHLSYRVQGITIPRDSHEQWMKAKPLKRAELKPADLIFSAKAENPKKVTHVALYAGDGLIIEAPQTGMTVRKVTFQEKYGKPLEEVESGDRVGERVIYFGSFLQ